MKFAVPTWEGKLCQHFGHCEVFTIVEELADGTLKSEAVTPPAHEPGVLPRWLAEQSVNCIIAGGMGMRAQELFKQSGIKVCVGASVKTPEELVAEFIAGTLVTGTNTCDH
ncbi:MAG: NifB/NifX family molybdenum-iron cluster-binding protein [Candidatus Wallbacteria bacterium]|nr:NifB/NifX family molybdenum-iron cluster-binding protein [Candidatus Wallbacteria bacterium]